MSYYREAVAIDFPASGPEASLLNAPISAVGQVAGRSYECMYLPSQIVEVGAFASTADKVLTGHGASPAIFGPELSDV